MNLSLIKRPLLRLQRILLFTIALCSFFHSFSQSEIKTKQRALFVMNTAQNFSWVLEDDKSTFNILILGDSILYREFKNLSKNRTINNRKINPIFKKNITPFKDFDLIYANFIYGDNASRILKLIDKRNTLLIGENYKFNECMINLLDVSNEFYYELNLGKLRAHQFRAPNSLITNAVSSSSKWFELYQESQKNLKTELDKVEKQKQIIKKQQSILNNLKKEVVSLQTRIFSLNKNIEKKSIELLLLQKQSEQQNKILNLKTAEISELEKQIEDSKTSLLKQEKLSDSLNYEIKKQISLVDKQNNLILNQSEKIKEQLISISQQDDELKTQRRINYLLYSVISLIALLGFLTYRFYKRERLFNSILSKKNKEIEERNKEVEQFAYIASHDLQAPVNTIAGFVELLEFKLQPKLDEDDLVSMSFIKDSSERMKELIKDLLEYSEIGKKDDLELFSFQEVFNNVLLDLKSEIDKKESIIKLYDSENISIRGNKTEIRLLLQNLISNAIKFSIPNKQLKIHVFITQKTRNKETRTTCIVDDNGIGIDQKYRDDVFDVFNRLHTNDEYEGTGIGLAHCKKIVRKHNGEIWIDDSHLGGTSFHFTLVDIK